MRSAGRRHPDGRRGRHLAFLQLGLRAFLAPDGVKRMLADAELALSLEKGFPLDAQAETKRALGVAAYLNGQDRRARAMFTDTASDAGISADRGLRAGLPVADRRGRGAVGRRRGAGCGALRNVVRR